MRILSRRRCGWVLALAFLFAPLAVPAPEGLSDPAWRTTGLAFAMAVLWAMEVLPFAVTALLPIVIIPLLGIGPLSAAATPYANPVIFLFLGGVLIALGMEQTGLHRRIALRILRWMGTRPASIVAGFLLAPAVLSMWINNTSAAVMMLPVGLSVVGLLQRSEALRVSGFAAALMLAIAYGANIGGAMTLIGTAPNIFFAGFIRETFGYSVGFIQWMMLALPVGMLLLPVIWWILTRLCFRLPKERIEGAAEILADESARLGAMQCRERRVAGVFVVTVILWLCRPLIPIEGLNDTVIAMLGGLALFVIPERGWGGRAVLVWEDAKRLPWDVVWLLGGGLSLAAAIEQTGLAAFIGGLSSQLGAVPLIVLAVVVMGLILVMTELTSNAATTATFLPVIGSVAIGMGFEPILLCALATLASSGAFMLPVATPPNAVVFGSGHLTIPQMLRAGLVANLVFFALLVAAVASYGRWIFPEIAGR